MKYNVIVEAANEVLSHYHIPITLRQLYYRLVAKQIIPNTRNSYSALSRFLVLAREKGEVDGAKLEDRTRATIGGEEICPEPADYVKLWIRSIKNSWQQYKRPLWEHQPSYVEAWVEKDALAGVISEVANEFRVMTCPTRGYSSYSYLQEAVKRFSHAPNTILYFGDFDPSGLDIPRDLKDRLKKYGVESLEVKRIALTADQIKKYNLPPAMAKATDARYNGFVADTGADSVVELDALEPDILQEMVNEAIKGEIDFIRWNRAKRREKIETVDLRARLDRLIITEAEP